MTIDCLRLRAWVLAGLLLVTAGCTTVPRFATINDVSVPAALNSGYTVVAIDNKAVHRAQGKLATVVPTAMVPEGTHQFTVKPRDEDAPSQTFTATVEAGKEYRIDVRDGMPMLVETQRAPGQPDSDFVRRK